VFWNVDWSAVAFCEIRIICFPEGNAAGALRGNFSLFVVLFVVEFLLMAEVAAS
jgi:hypothetical protein